MSTAFIGQIVLFAGNFAPRGWAFCQGQLLAISQNTALFSILGTTYGGNGQTTFALPDLRGRVPLGTGQGPGLTNRDLGELGGTESITLTQAEMPLHSHAAQGSSGERTTDRPNNAVPARGGAYGASANVAMSASANSPVGGGQPHENVQPYLGLNYIICIEGIYPSRN